MKLFTAQFLKKHRRSSGFTLIELLVVIGILGILATELVATIDPFEQLKKAQDANVKNTAVEYVDANIRYYTTHNMLPWGNTDTYGAACGTAVGGGSGTDITPTSTLTMSNLTDNCLAELINDGELKTAFTSAGGVLGAIILRGTTNAVTACFAPQSRAQRSDNNTKYKLDAGNNFTIAPGAQCPNATATDCYWCAQ
jgi:prepilin-type N-terminal cleavage/methylation domain-containing protein